MSVRTDATIMTANSAEPTVTAQPTVAAQPTVTAPPADPPAVSRPRSFERIGAYSIVRTVGEGGMGTVYEALHDAIGRRAAIKVLRPELSQNAEISARFLNEARAVNVVNHPGVVNIFELGQLADQTAYIVMEYLDGESLVKRTQGLGGRLPPPLAVQLFRQVASTLQRIHDKGIVHRDLKPDNLMLVRDPEVPGGERTKLLDFGIAKLAAEYQSAGGNLRTKTGTVIGTPIYMAPEQCDGAKDATDRADVYSLGVMLFEALAGRPPFNADGWGRLMVMHMSETPPSVRELAPEVPQGLAELVHAMLAKAPAQRPSMGEVAARLEELGAPKEQLTKEAAASAGTATATARRYGRQAGRSVFTRVYGGWSSAALLLGLSGGLAVGALAGTLGQRALTRRTQLRVPAASPAATAAKPAPLVRWSVDSRPSGAAVIRAADGTLLGTTPWRAELLPAGERWPLLLRQSGFQDATAELDQSRDGTQVVTLAPQPPTEPPTAGKKRKGQSGELPPRTRPRVKDDADVRIIH